MRNVKALSASASQSFLLCLLEKVIISYAERLENEGRKEEQKVKTIHNKRGRVGGTSNEITFLQICPFLLTTRDRIESQGAKARV